MRVKPFLVAILFAAFAMPALAQAPQGTPANVRGKIVKASAQTLTVKTREGPTVDIALAANTSVRTLQKKKLSDIKSGDFIASTAMPGKDGKLHAVEVHFLPPAAPELQIPYDYKPGSTMTNAHVVGIVKAKGGTILQVTYKGTQTDLVIDKKTMITTGADGAASDLKPGKTVFLRANKAADGSLSANNVTVEKNGVKPPM